MKKGKQRQLPIKIIADKEITIELGPQPEIPEKKVERMTEGRQSSLRKILLIQMQLIEP